MSKRIAVIMAGGSGERFWPMSRHGRPKQLLRLTSPHETMLEEAVSRIAPLVGEGNVILAIGGSIKDAVLEAQIVAEDNVWSEPAKRNTLGCLVWTAAKLLSRGEEVVTVGVLTADHSIGEPEKFRATVGAAMAIAEKEHGIVTIGIRPDRPETGYGYIESDPSQTVVAGDRTGFRSKSFREKPSLETANEFLAAGNFFWNGGMFFFRLSVFLEELKAAQPEAYRLTMEIADALKSDARLAETLFEGIPSISVDFAIMEKAKDVYVVPSDFPWDDMGSWDSLQRSFPMDAEGNVCEGPSVLIDTKDCVVYNDQEGAVIGTVGLQDIVIVATDGAILVCHKDQAQRVREIVGKLS